MTKTETTSKRPTHRVYAVTKTGGDKLLDRDRRGLGEPGRQGLQREARLSPPQRGRDRHSRTARRTGSGQGRLIQPGPPCEGGPFIFSSRRFR